MEHDKNMTWFMTWNMVQEHDNEEQVEGYETKHTSFSVHRRVRWSGITLQDTRKLEKNTRNHYFQLLDNTQHNHLRNGNTGWGTR